MEEKFFTVKEVTINNHCPECYSNNGMQLTFKQKFVENYFYKAISNDTKHTLICRTCHSEIYPVSWTHDLEQVFDYQQRALVPKAATFKLKKLSWILLIAAIALIILLNIYIFNR
jgi:hypothetical protein